MMRSLERTHNCDLTTVIVNPILSTVKSETIVPPGAGVGRSRSCPESARVGVVRRLNRSRPKLVSIGSAFHLVLFFFFSSFAFLTLWIFVN